MVRLDSTAKKEIEKRVIEIFSSQGWIRVSEAQRKAEKQGIFQSTFYRWLRRLVKEGILEKDRKVYKDSKYRLNPSKMPKGLWEQTILKQEGLSLINRKMERFGLKRPEDEVFKELSQWLGALSLYSAYEAMKKGQLSLIDVPAYYVTYIGGVYSYMSRPIADRVILEKMKTKRLTGEEYTQLLIEYQNPFRALEKEEIAQPALKEMQKSLESAFGKEKIKEFERLFETVLEKGQSPSEISFKSEKLQSEKSPLPAEETQKLIEASMRTDDRNQKSSSTKKKPRPKGRVYSHPEYGPSNLKAESDSQENREREDQGKTE